MPNTPPLFRKFSCDAKRAMSSSISPDLHILPPLCSCPSKSDHFQYQKYNKTVQECITTNDIYEAVPSANLFTPIYLMLYVIIIYRNH